MPKPSPYPVTWSQFIQDERTRHLLWMMGALPIIIFVGIVYLATLFYTVTQIHAGHLPAHPYLLFLAAALFIIVTGMRLAFVRKAHRATLRRIEMEEYLKDENQGDTL